MIIFIVGTGRTGSCWLGRLLAAHPEITGTIEEEPQFRWITGAALYPSSREDLLPSIIERMQEKEEAHGIYSEKSHPALWLIEPLAAALPSARFVCIERGRDDVVASMMKHEGVRRRCEEFRQYPQPCPFLGMETYDSYAALTMPERCAARWWAHKLEWARVEPDLHPYQRFTIRYETLKAAPAAQLYLLQKHLGLSEPFEVVA